MSVTDIFDSSVVTGKTSRPGKKGTNDIEFCYILPNTRYTFPPEVLKRDTCPTMKWSYKMTILFPDTDVTYTVLNLSVLSVETG